MSLVMMTDLLWFLHVEVVVAGKVGVQNEFLDFIVLRIKENVLKLSHLGKPSFVKKKIFCEIISLTGGGGSD